MGKGINTMTILLEEMVKIIIIAAMLQIVHLLDDNKNKIMIISVISIIINYFLLSIDLTKNTVGYVAFYHVNILIIATMCKELNKGLFYGICYYFIQPIISVAILYLNVCMNMQFSSLASYIITLLSAGILAGVHYLKLVRYRGNLIVLFLLNTVALLISMYYGYCLMSNYVMLSEVFYYGLIILVIWIVLNKLLCRNQHI